MLFQWSDARHIGKDVLIFIEECLNIRLLLYRQVLADLHVLHGLCLEWVQSLEFRSVFREFFFGLENCCRSDIYSNRAEGDLER